MTVYFKKSPFPRAGWRMQRYFFFFLYDNFKTKYNRNLNNIRQSCQIATISVNFDQAHHLFAVANFFLLIHHYHKKYIYNVITQEAVSVHKYVYSESWSLSKYLN